MNTDIFKKLHILDGMQYLIRNAPSDFVYPPDCIPMETHIDYVHIFCATLQELNSAFAEMKQYDVANALIWLSYPKKNSASYVELNQDMIIEAILTFGYHAISQVSLDDTWSALRLMNNI